MWNEKILSSSKLIHFNYRKKNRIIFYFKTPNTNTVIIEFISNNDGKVGKGFILNIAINFRKLLNIKNKYLNLSFVFLLLKLLLLVHELMVSFDVKI